MKISASLHAADPLRLAEAIAAVAPHVASLHVDVIDGRFAPAFGFGERLVRSVIAKRAPPVDVHLMVERPESWAVRFAALGARLVAFHLEAVSDVVATANAIRAEGALAYVALLPDTPTSRVPNLRGAFDGLLLLTAPPGGGSFNQAAFSRIESLPKGRPAIVDGRIEPRHFDALKSNGIATAVVGTCLFEGVELAEQARRLSEAAAA
jgi:ribulose-phosphate 3-epimerase